MDELVAGRDAAAGVEMVELRLDGIDDVDVGRALEGRTLPAIVTCRPEREGGRHRGAERDRLAILSAAAAAGAEYVDVEWRAKHELVPHGRRVVSLHDFSGLPADLAATVEAMRASAPDDVVKVAVMATRVADCVQLRAAMPREGRHVAIAMGQAGAITRICPWLFGSCWVYAGSAAPGQLSVRDLRDRFRVGESTAATTLYAVVGLWDAAVALAAAHNAEFRARGLDALSVPLAAADARDLDCAVRAFAVAAVSDAAAGADPQALTTQARRDVGRWMTT
jgi:3-dehydroquinate dehydratase/shikimate dehydrogenase